MNTSRDSWAKSISPKLEIVRTPGTENCERLKMMVSRFGKGLPMDSKVFRPMTTTLLVVSCLNHLKSSGKCHGILFPAPITRLSDMAAMALKFFTTFRLAGCLEFVNQELTF